MGPRGSKPEGDLLADFEVGRRLDADGLLFLTHTHSRRDYLLRELTFNDKREF
jgi:hypothetical protein